MASEIYQPMHDLNVWTWNEHIVVPAEKLIIFYWGRLKVAQNGMLNFEGLQFKNCLRNTLYFTLLTFYIVGFVLPIEEKESSKTNFVVLSLRLLGDQASVA